MTTLSLDVYVRLIVRLARLAARDPERMQRALADVGIRAEDLERDEGPLKAQLAEMWPRRHATVAWKLIAALSEELTRDGPLGVRPASSVAPHIEPEKSVPTYMQPSAPPAPPLPTTPPASTPPALPKPPPAALAATMDPDMGKILASIARALPFAPGAEPPAPKPPKPAPTVELPIMDPTPEVTHPGPNSLERYAAICGALARGLPRDQALAACNSSPEDFDNLIKFWGPRFEQDLALLTTFHDMVKAHAAPANSAE